MNYTQSKPVTIRGVDYPSMAAAGRALGVSKGTVWMARRAGTLHRVGTGKVGIEPMRVKIRGQVFETAKDAADHFGVALRTVHEAIALGVPDRIGRKRTDNPSRAKPVTIGGMSFPTRSAASLALGYNVDYVSGVLQSGCPRKYERLMGAVMRLQAAPDGAVMVRGKVV